MWLRNLTLVIVNKTCAQETIRAHNSRQSCTQQCFPLFSALGRQRKVDLAYTAISRPAEATYETLSQKKKLLRQGKFQG